MPSAFNCFVFVDFGKSKSYFLICLHVVVSLVKADCILSFYKTLVISLGVFCSRVSRMFFSQWY